MHVRQNLVGNMIFFVVFFFHYVDFLSFPCFVVLYRESSDHRHAPTENHRVSGELALCQYCDLRVINDR